MGFLSEETEDNQIISWTVFIDFFSITLILCGRWIRPYKKILTYALIKIYRYINNYWKNGFNHNK